MSPSIRSRRQVGTHLDAASRRRRAAGCPVERPVEVGHLYDVIATELLLGFGERPILHLALTIPEPDRRGERPRLETRAADHPPGGRPRPPGSAGRPPSDGPFNLRRVRA